MIIVFKTNTQKLLWDNYFVDLIKDGVWSEQYNNYRWQSCDTYVGNPSGTNMPKFEKRYDLYNDRVQFVHGWLAVAIIRVSTYFELDSIPRYMNELINHLIFVSELDYNNKTYRVSQINGWQNRVKYSYTPENKKRFSELVGKLKRDGFSLDDFITALSTDNYSMKQFNSDLTEMNSIIRDVRETRK